MTKRTPRAFSLVELIVVLGVVGLLLALSTPGLLQLPAVTLTSSGNEFANIVSLCRSEAIRQNTATRVGIIVSSPVDEEEFRYFSGWRWDRTESSFRQFTSWKALAEGNQFQQELPKYLYDAEYAKKDPSLIRGVSLVSADIEEKLIIDPVTKLEKKIRFVQFSPSGRASVPLDESRNIIALIAKTNTVSNWVQINIDTLTGRSFIYRP
jgi:prepilin-type N-terminal cleavage/methylation domain-containing protein